MNGEIDRILPLPGKSFLLLGPRGTGKSTLMKMKLRPKVEIDLLRSAHYLPLLRDPSLLREWVGHLKPGDWVLVDEVQKIPALLDEVHSLYEDMKLHFALSGSSARKLRRGGANLLAGRAIQVPLFPLVHSEIGNRTSFHDYIEWGGLPAVVTDPTHRRDTLAAYVESYLKQELIAEGLIRRLEPFARFLQVAGIHNGQVLNVENIAREAHLKRTTVDTYFEILDDTLIGFRLPSINLGLHAKEIRHPKFYFFDSGVARASAGLSWEEVDSVWRGFALETQILHEIRAYNAYFRKGKDLFYYKVTSGMEVDFVVETRRKTLSRPRSLLAIEVKAATDWDRRWTRPLAGLLANGKSRVDRALGIYQGDRVLRQEGVEIFPVPEFLDLLFKGELW